MTKYTPPPPTLDHLNPIQRYLQKGSLDRQDWIRLGAIIFAYFIARPYLEKAAAWWMGSKEGVQAQKDYHERRAAAKIGANAIRGAEKKESLIDELAEGDQVVTSARTEDKSKAVNRKNKGQQRTAKSHEDTLVDWDDEPVAASADGDKGDVVQWLNKWEQEAEQL